MQLNRILILRFTKPNQRHVIASKLMSPNENIENTHVIRPAGCSIYSV